MKFYREKLKNGLTVLFNKDENTPIAAVNIIYNVGSKNEEPDHTGYAHFMEHLMFTGTVNEPDYDKVVENIGGTNNAFTNNDYTNYFLLVPKNNIETALWLEADRMFQLAFYEQSFENQRNVVIEEFKQTTLNEPYGDDSMLLSELAYKVHPYRWTTIGKEIAHIENATLDYMKAFYKKFYAPDNAILSIGGNFEPDFIFDLVHRWFGSIPASNVMIENRPQEPEQTERREKTVYRPVPFDALYMAFHIGGRLSEDYYLFDIITDILDSGRSARFYQNLIKENHFFEDIDAYITGNHDNGLVVIEGKPAEGIDVKQAENAVWQELNELKQRMVLDKELQKSLNALEMSLAYNETNVFAKTRTLAYFELLGDANLINTEKERYLTVNKQGIMQAAQRVFRPEKVSVLYYLSQKTNRR